MKKLIVALYNFVNVPKTEDMCDFYNFVLDQIKYKRKKIVA
jgi:hypothetical protein